MSKLWPDAQVQAEPVQRKGVPSSGQASAWNGVMLIDVS
jgi:hypothetical protein